jgi:elongation factor G
MDAIGNGTRAIALVGPAGAGKTSLAEALLHAAGAIHRLGSVEGGSSLGDASPEARARGGSTELNLLRFDWGGDGYVLLDAPGSPSFAGDAACALEVADLALVVIGPEPERAALAEPILRELEANKVPHAIFVNKIDKARGSIEAVLEALQPMSRPPLVARQIPISSGEDVTGFVDLALDRAWKYRPGQPSEQVPIAEDLQATESAAHFKMLEHLADHDDYLLEQLLTDQEPDLATVFGDLKRETADGLIVPIFFGSALNGFGVRRLLKALRHDTPAPATTASRHDIDRAAAQVFKISHGSTVGRLALARIFGGALAEGAELYGPDGKPQRTGSLFAIQGAATTKLAKAAPGDVVGIAKADAIGAGDRLGIGAPATANGGRRTPPVANSALSISVKDHKDEVRLSTALNKLVEEDPGLSWDTIDETHETLLHGLSDEHLQVALERLRRRYGVAVNVGQPSVAFRETIRKPASQRGRHKKQSGGHGQYGDAVIEIRPLPRGEGFVFEDRITGGVIPRQYIPAVEAGIRDAMLKGPLGCRVVDVAVALVDGSYHSVDSSELAFRTAGRMAMSAALAAASPYLLEPVAHVTIHSPGSATSKITSALSSHRARVLGMEPREGWSRWETIEALVPEAELRAFSTELRSYSQGMASYEARHDHLAEVNEKLAQTLAQQVHEPA